MKRLFTILSALSLLLCTATAALWVRSYWRSDAIVYYGRDGHYAVQWAAGLLLLGTDNVGTPNPRLGIDSWNNAWKDPRLDNSLYKGSWGRWGFGHDRTVTPITTLSTNTLASFPNPPAMLIHRRLSLPLWLFTLAFAIPPCRAATIRWRAHQRRRNTLCVTCGYDLRASQDRCPECGTPIPANTASCSPSPHP